MKTFSIILLFLTSSYLWANETAISFDSVRFQKGSNTFLILGNGNYQVHKELANGVVKEGRLPDSILPDLNEVMASLPESGEVKMEQSERYPDQKFSVYRKNELFRVSGNSLFPEPYVSLQRLMGSLEYEMLSNIVFTNEGFINVEGKNVLGWYIHHKRTLEEMDVNYRSWPDNSELVFYVIPQNKKYLKCAYDYILYLPEPPKYFDVETGMRIPNPEKPTVVDTTDAGFIKSLLKDMKRYSCR